MLLESNEFRDLISKQITERFSNEEVQDFFGITIKSTGVRREVFNIYDKDGNLLLAEEEDWSIQSELNNVIGRILKKICSEAEIDTKCAIKYAKKAAKEFEKAQEEKENERRKDWETCPVCGERHPKGTHFHAW